MARCGGCAVEEAIVRSLELEVAAYDDMLKELDDSLTEYDNSIDSLELALETCKDCLTIGGTSPYAKNIRATISNVTKERDAIQTERDNTQICRNTASSNLTQARANVTSCNSETCVETTEEDNKVYYWRSR